jgi:hypothetical protein
MTASDPLTLARKAALIKAYVYPAPNLAECLVQLNARPVHILVKYAERIACASQGPCSTVQQHRSAVFDIASD